MLNEGTDLLLYLLRHGESEGNVKRLLSSRLNDPPLSAVGRRQAERQAERLSAVTFSALYASPLIRARQTAAIVGERCGLMPIVEEALAEVDVGLLDGESLNDPQSRQRYELILADWGRGLSSVRFPGGESLDEVHQRLGGFLVRLKHALPGRVLLVGHSLLFAAAIWLYCENHPSTFTAGHMGRGHLSVIAGRDERFRLVEFNHAPALQE